MCSSTAAVCSPLDTHPRAGRARPRLALLARLALLGLALLALGGCLTTSPDEDPEPAARLVAMWDPLTCANPHRVVLELEDDDGASLSMSAPCALGSLALDVPRWGIYYGRFYGWELGQPIRGVAPVTIMIDAPVIRWQLSAPP